MTSEFKIDTGRVLFKNAKCTHVLCSSEYRQLENDNARELWDKEKSILLKKVAKLLDSRKRAGRVEEERLQQETTASAQPITQDLPAQHLHQVQSTLHINPTGIS